MKYLKIPMLLAFAISAGAVAAVALVPREDNVRLVTATSGLPAAITAAGVPDLTLLAAPEITTTTTTTTVPQVSIAAPVTVPTTTAAAVVAAPVPAPAAKSECEIAHAANGDHDAWAVYGYSTLPRGATFTYTVTVDGVSTSVALVSKAGSARVNGVVHGDPGGYVDDGTNVFGNTQQDMPVLKLPHGPVSASVSQGGTIICQA